MRTGKVGGSGRGGLFPNSLKIISSCLKTVSTNASSVVRSAGASVAASIAAAPSDNDKEQVLWAGFDKLELGPAAIHSVLLLGYASGFQVVDVEDASNVSELVSKRDGPVTFLQMQPFPEKAEGHDRFLASRPLLLVVGGDESNDDGHGHGHGLVQGPRLNGSVRDGSTDTPLENNGSVPTVVRFYSLRSDSYVHVLRFRSAVHLIRSSPRIIAVALPQQIYCFDAVTLENKFSVLTYPSPQGGQGTGIHIGYGPMAVGHRWLAYASNNPLIPITGRLSPQNLTPSPGVSPSTSPVNGSMMARYAVESSKQIAAGLLNLGDASFRTLSKYCHELLPDGSSSPVSSSSLKGNRITSLVHPADTENEGMVVVKDYMTKAIISQFRAHTSPISALCFDPSGTLLVTASVHGNSINVFRIMPSHTQNGSYSARYDWSVSHVHIYKLYRGLTTAVIQDICFSHYSQWVAIISSKGTCHIYVLSPYGGEVSFQTQSFHSEGPILSPTLSLPWWSSTVCNINSQLPVPPAPITLSVVSRIKSSGMGWLNTMTNVATSSTGKISTPSGALAAVFHNSFRHNKHPGQLKANSLEHLLVYSPSGHVVQHQLLPSIGLESSEFTLKTVPSQFQDDDLRVSAESVQCWSVCRRSNWPERGGLLGISFDKLSSEGSVIDGSDSEDNDTTSSSKSLSVGSMGKELLKNHERPHWYLSNAEVQINSGSIPIWQKSKIYFYTMFSPRTNDLALSADSTGGEMEIEKVPVHEVEFKQRDLLPVLEHFQCGHSDWTDRSRSGECYPATPSLEAHQTKEKFVQETYSQLAKLEGKILDGGSFTGFLGPQGNFMDSSKVNSHRGSLSEQSSDLLSHPLNQIERKLTATHLIPQNSFQRDSLLDEGSDHVGCNPPDHVGFNLPVSNFFSSEGPLNSIRGQNMTEEMVMRNQLLVTEMDCASSPLTTHPSGPQTLSEEVENVGSDEPLPFAEYLEEGYCRVSELNDCRGLPDVATDVDSNGSSHGERDKPEEDDQDDMHGGVFNFCDEG